MLRKCLFIVCAVAFMSALVSGTATAQDNNWNQRTYFTFSAPVELPGKTLPAGTYLFRLVDSPSNRHVVQVFDKDEKNILATVLAIPAQRMEPSDDPEVRFMEVAASQPAAIRTWWFPGRTIGHEFIYPKEQAMRLAKGAKTSVLTVATDATTTETMREADLARADAAGQTTATTTTTTTTEVSGTAFPGRTSVETQTAVSQTTRSTPPPPESAATTVPQSTAVTQRPVETTTPAPTRSTESVTTTRTELPHTATFLPLVGLFGLGSLAGATVLRYRRK
jgi:hypothetical protein